MKKSLIVTSVASMIQQFNISNIKILQDLGYEVTVATNFTDSGTITIEESKKLLNTLIRMGVNAVNVEFHRRPLNKQNLKAYKQLKNILSNNYYEIVHCQSPIGGMLARIVAKDTRNKGTKVIYTAHGFHFYEGAPLKNWLLFYPVERFFSRFTDVLITINQEDYKRAQTFKAKQVEYIPGVGVDISQYNNLKVNKNRKRNDLNLPHNSFVISSVGELNDNKNHKIIIEALGKIKDENIHYVICGIGPNKKQLQILAEKYGIEKNFHLLGYRTDISEILTISDVFAFPSKREGLGLAAIEAMASGLPIITSNVHGILDYSVNGETGFIFSPDNVNEAKEAIEKVYKLSDQEVKYISENNKIKSEKYNQLIVNEQMKLIYESIIME